MAPVDLAPAERSMPVGYKLHPTDQELVGHYLRHKLKADLSIHDPIPEIGICKGEPWVYWIGLLLFQRPSLMNHSAFSSVLATISTLTVLGRTEQPCVASGK